MQKAAAIAAATFILAVCSCAAPVPPPSPSADHVQAAAQKRNLAIERMTAEQQAGLNAEKAGDRRGAFDHYVHALQIDSGDQDPAVAQISDDTLQKLSTLLIGIQPPPMIPAEADVHNRRAIAILHMARTDDDNDRGAQELREAISPRRHGLRRSISILGSSSKRRVTSKRQSAHSSDISC